MPSSSKLVTLAAACVLPFTATTTAASLRADKHNSATEAVQSPQKYVLFTNYGERDCSDTGKANVAFVVDHCFDIQGTITSGLWSYNSDNQTVSYSTCFDSHCTKCSPSQNVPLDQCQPGQGSTKAILVDELPAPSDGRYVTRQCSDKILCLSNMDFDVQNILFFLNCTLSCRYLHMQFNNELSGSTEGCHSEYLHEATYYDADCSYVAPNVYRKAWCENGDVVVADFTSLSCDGEGTHRHNVTGCSASGSHEFYVATCQGDVPP